MTSSNTRKQQGDFASLCLNDKLLSVLNDLSYSQPTPIQQEIIPHIMAGRDVVGQAQTGTGKTAAFALPLLHKMGDVKCRKPQILVLAPTRELAIQVSRNFAEYASGYHHIKVLAIYGGQEYASQLQQLRRGVNVVVGTPGRIMDHIRKQTLDLSDLQSLVIDEADEMLKMGFIDDVTWILEQTPENRQMALFSATMPESIRSIAVRHLKNPEQVTIAKTENSTGGIEQHYLQTGSEREKRSAITAILETENIDGVIVFVRTKSQTVELAEHLQGLGHKCGALNGDIQQDQRIRMIEHLKSGLLDIVVATDVAARGIDVERVSHVINYDIPFDAESYVHRIGRTGRAGRTGKAILFIRPKEKRLLTVFARHTKGEISKMTIPTAREINACRKARFLDKIEKQMQGNLSAVSGLLEEFCQKKEVDPLQVAAALASMQLGDKPFFQEEKKERAAKPTASKPVKKARQDQKRPDVPDRPEEGMERYRIEIGLSHGVTARNIVGAIANEADIDSTYIGKISIFSDYSTVDLPYGMPRQILKVLQRARIYDKRMQMRREEAAVTAPSVSPKKRPQKKAHRKTEAKKAGKKNTVPQRSAVI